MDGTHLEVLVEPTPPAFSHRPEALFLEPRRCSGFAALDGARNTASGARDPAGVAPDGRLVEARLGVEAQEIERVLRLGFRAVAPPGQQGRRGRIPV